MHAFRSFVSLSPSHATFMTYGLIMFLVSTGDAILSYAVPVFLEDTLSNPFWMGIILSTSSVVGLLADLFIGEWCKEKGYSFFLCWMFVMAAAFPLSLLFLPAVVPVFILAMAFWGVYYELIQFTNYHFVHTFLTRNQHASAWGILSLFFSFAYFLGPILAGRYLDESLKTPFIVAILILTCGLLSFMLFLHRYHEKGVNQHPRRVRKNIFTELQVWAVLFRSLWPLWFFHLTLNLIDATFWSIGTVFSEQLRSTHPLGAFFFVAYMLPALVVGFFVGRLAQPFGKKKIAFLAGLGCGFFLFFAGLTTHIPLLLLFVFLSSACSAIASPELSATFEDYVSRLGNRGNELVGLNQTASSVAYIIGPVLAGGVA
ncbi:MAG TPA: MFS transporter, partial [Patescibacteria group bacterium]|nr:MFS transporter [Patescibacteria group bacterium]